MILKIKDILEDAEDAEEDDVFEDPNGSIWTISVDMHGHVSILKAPNIHSSFLEPKNAEEIGIPFESNDPPGVYEWTCSFWQSKDRESGHVDDYGFDVNSTKKLWCLNETKE